MLPPTRPRKICRATWVGLDFPGRRAGRGETGSAERGRIYALRFCGCAKRGSSRGVGHSHFIVVPAATPVRVVMVGNRLMTVYTLEAVWNHRRLSTELIAVEWVGLVRVNRLAVAVPFHEVACGSSE